MKVFFIGAGPGDVELITLKGHRILHACPFVMYAGSLINKELLNDLPDSTKTFDTAELDLGQQVALYKEAYENEMDVARLQSGDLSIYGSIGEQMRKLDELGIDYEIIPGVSSVAASAAALRKELTLPNVSQTVILSRVSGRTKVPPDEELELLASHKCTLCLFLSILKLREAADKLAKYYDPKTPVAVVYKASWPDEKIIKGDLTNIADLVEKENITLTALIMVGNVLESSDFEDSKLYSEDFSHRFRKKNGKS